MKKQAGLILCALLSSPAWSQSAVVQYDWNQAEIGGDNCPLKISNFKVSADGREITLDSSSWSLSLSQTAGGLLADATCIIRIPTTVPANYQVLQVNQSLSYSYSKTANSTVAVYASARLFDLTDVPIDIKLGDNVSGTKYSVRQGSTANVSSWTKWCQDESQKGILAINLAASILRDNRSQNVWIQLGQPNSPYKLRLETVSCQSNLMNFLGSLGDRQDSCKTYNRDGLTCAGVDLHSPNAEACRWQSQWQCLDNGCAGYKGAGDCA